MDNETLVGRPTGCSKGPGLADIADKNGTVAGREERPFLLIH